MRFGLGIPTCREGLAYPSGFADLDDICALAQQAERDGYDALWGNDHLITQQVVMDTLPVPPSFYEPLITFAYLSGQTSRIRFVVGTVVAPLRETVLLAKQAATLDQVSHGRFVLGLGIGAYREEFEALAHRSAGANRGAMLEESVLALRALFEQRRASFAGRSVRFREIEVYPKPVQQPFPMYLGGNSAAAIERAGRLANGLIIAGVSPEQAGAAVDRLHGAARAAGRDPAELETCVQVWVAVGATEAAAGAALTESQHFRRIRALHPNESVEQLTQAFTRANLYGDAEAIRRQIAAYEEAGTDHLALIFLADTADELAERAHLFAAGMGLAT